MAVDFLITFHSIGLFLFLYLCGAQCYFVNLSGQHFWSPKMVFLFFGFDSQVFFIRLRLSNNSVPKFRIGVEQRFKLKNKEIKTQSGQRGRNFFRDVFNKEQYLNTRYSIHAVYGRLISDSGKSSIKLKWQGISPGNKVRFYPIFHLY